MTLGKVHESDGTVPPGKLRVSITSLEMLRRPAGGPLAPPRDDLEVRRIRGIALPFYRFLYDTVGEQWLWGDRRKLSDESLTAILSDPLVEVYVAYVGGQPAGFAELDRRIAGEVELAYFGILPGFIGGGLGPFLLSYAIDRAWHGDPEGEPKRLWVHTCSLDHPAALGVYRKAGFVPFDTTEKIEDDPRVLGLIPEHAAPQHPINT